MEFPALQAISPVDGRYRNLTGPLAAFFSESGIIRYRVRVEIEYFLALRDLGIPGLSAFPAGKSDPLRGIHLNFSETDAGQVKEIEKTTNHDIKAVEVFLRNRFDSLDLGQFKEFIHFGLTSQDINNTAFPMALRDAFHDSVYPALEAVRQELAAKAREWKDIPMLARTHGQPASPTSLGKELHVFVERLDNQFVYFKNIPFNGKFGGATGNFNAHYAAYPDRDWNSFADHFLLNRLGLVRQQTTTQIEHYDNLAAFFDNCRRINTILLDLVRDCWTYISMEYFRQKVSLREVGSSAMPHKVNPIDFENAEGNLGLANAVFGFLSAKLPVSRLQRDLTDSTVIRNIGVPLAHSLIAYRAILKGLDKLILHEEKIREDLGRNWAVIAEAIQTILRRENYPDPYNALKALTRGQHELDRQTFESFIDSLDIREEIREELHRLRPDNYLGRVSF